MVEQEIKEIWKGASAEERITFDVSRWTVDVQHRMHKLEQAIRKRDVTDMITFFVSIPIFGYLAYVVPFPVTKLGILLGLVSFIWNIIAKRRHQKQKIAVDPATSFKDQLERQKIRLLKEVHLLDTVIYWFLIPGFIPYVIAIVGLGDPAEYGISNAFINQVFPLSSVFKLGAVLLAGGVYAAIYWANKTVIKKTLMPMIREIDDAQKQLSQD